MPRFRRRRSFGEFEPVVPFILRTLFGNIGHRQTDADVSVCVSARLGHFARTFRIARLCISLTAVGSDSRAVHARSMRDRRSSRFSIILNRNDQSRTLFVQRVIANISMHYAKVARINHLRERSTRHNRDRKFRRIETRKDISSTCDGIRSYICKL